MEGKVILSILIVGVLMVGAVTTATMVDAQRPPEKDPDRDGLFEGVVWEIIGMLSHPDWGLEIIDDEVEHIEVELHDSDYGLDAIDNEVEHNTALLEDSDFGLDAQVNDGTYGLKRLASDVQHDDWGLEIIDDEVEHIEVELHDSDYGLDAIDDQVEHIEAELHDSDYGLNAIDNQVEDIEEAVFDSDFGLEAIHDDIHDLGGTGIKPYKVQIDMRFNQYDGADLVFADSLSNRFGVIAHCPSEDPNCGQFTFASVKNLNGFKYVYPNKNGNSHEESKSVCGPAGCLTDVNVGLLNSVRTLTHFDLDDTGNVITSDQSIFDIPIPVLIGTEANILETSGLGTQYGQKMVFTTNPIPYTGVMEFLIYAPVGSSFTHIWGCDNLGLDPSKKDSIHDIVEQSAADPGLALATFAGILTAEIQHNCDWESDSPKWVAMYSPTKFPAP